MPIVDRGQNFIIFGVDNISSKHTDNRKKDILVLGEKPTNELDDTTVTMEAKYSAHITKSIKKLNWWLMK